MLKIQRFNIKIALLYNAIGPWIHIGLFWSFTLTLTEIHFSNKSQIGKLELCDKTYCSIR